MDGPPHAQHDRAPMVRQDGLVALIEEHVVVVHGIARADLGDVPSHLCPLPLVGVEEDLHLGPDGQDGVVCGVRFDVDREVVSIVIGGGLCQHTTVHTTIRTDEREGRLCLHPGSLLGLLHLRPRGRPCACAPARVQLCRLQGLVQSLVLRLLGGALTLHLAARVA